LIFMRQKKDDIQQLLVALKTCSPVQLTSHIRWSKLTNALGRAYAATGSWVAVTEICFNQSGDSISNSDSFSSSDISYTPPLSFPIRLNSTAGPQTYNFVNDNHYTKSLEVEFNPISCWSYAKNGYENLKSIEAAFFEEISQFEACAADFVKYKEDLSQLDKAVHKCIKVRTGISSQYFYRSLYAAQLVHCFKYINPNQVLLLSSEALQLNPKTTLRRVLDFIGLQMDESIARNLSSSHIGQVISETFPSEFLLYISLSCL